MSAESIRRVRAILSSANVGRVIEVGGKLPINLSLGGYANVVHPALGATWQLRTQITAIF